MRAEKDGLQVHVDDVIPFRLADFDHGLDLRAAGDVDQNVDAPPATERRLYHLLYRCLSGHVGDDGKGLSAFLRDLRCARFAGLAIDVSDGDLRAFAAA